MSKWVKVVSTVIFIGLLLAGGVWAVLYRQAYNTVNRAMSDLARGTVPPPMQGPAAELGEVLVALDRLDYRVIRVRLRSPSKAEAQISLVFDQSSTLIVLGLKRSRGGWIISQSPAVRIAPAIRDEGGILVFKEGSFSPPESLESEAVLLLLVDERPALIWPLVPAGRDKLLSRRLGKLEFLKQGFLEPMPWFQSFVRLQPGPLILGMEEVSLYLWQGRLAVASSSMPYIPDRVRVNISTSGYHSIHHQNLTISSLGSWRLQEPISNSDVQLPQGIVALRPEGGGIIADINGSQRYFSGRLVFSSAYPLSVQVERSGGRFPQYRGHLEVVNFDGHLVVVNELTLEEYLYGVVPGEMPTSFGGPALEVQAIIARTYAINNILASSWQSTSAHVVDSVLSQVYKNTSEQTATNAAVDNTAGIIVTFQGKPAAVKFFSTSSGYTASSHQVWSDGGQFPGQPVGSLTAGPQYPDAKEGPVFGADEYRNFILSPPQEAYDSGSPWFRWQVTVPAPVLGGTINKYLKERHQNDPASILQVEGGQVSQVAFLPDNPLGELVDIRVVQRGEGGVLMEVDLVGSQGTWRVQREYNIRYILRPIGSPTYPITLSRHDGSVLANFSMLPSAFVFWDIEEREEAPDLITFYGGGFGHGVGMSQYGVRELVRRGWSREEIISHYFPGTEIDLVQRVQ